MHQTYSDLNNTQNICVYQGSITNTAIIPTYIWKKPIDCQLVYIYAVGGGGGGGSGSCRGATTYNTGGGGGNSGQSTVFVAPANTLPDILYVSPGYGGSGAPGAVYPNLPTNGTGGGSSKVSISFPVQSVFDDFKQTLVVAGGGNGGTGGGTVAQSAYYQSNTGARFGTLTGGLPSTGHDARMFIGVTTQYIGDAGLGTFAYNVTATGDMPNITFLPRFNRNILTVGGSCGGYAVSSSTVNASAYPGGGISLENTILSSIYLDFSSGIIPGGASGTTSAANGICGIGYGLDLTNSNYINTLNLIHPLFFTGGSGGGGCAGQGNGGDGGHGGLGSGGGGGGGSNATSSLYRGGNGGNGGPGFIIIISI